MLYALNRDTRCTISIESHQIQTKKNRHTKKETTIKTSVVERIFCILTDQHDRYRYRMAAIIYRQKNSVNREISYLQMPKIYTSVESEFHYLSVNNRGRLKCTLI